MAYNLEYVNDTTWNPNVELISLQISGNYLFAIDPVGNRLQSMDISDPTISLPWWPLIHADIDDPFDFTIFGDFAIISCAGNNSLVKIDISDPENMSYVETLALGPDNVYGIAAQPATWIGPSDFLVWVARKDDDELTQVFASSTPMLALGSYTSNVSNPTYPKFGLNNSPLYFHIDGNSGNLMAGEGIIGGGANDIWGSTIPTGSPFTRMAAGSSTSMGQTLEFVADGGSDALRMGDLKEVNFPPYSPGTVTWQSLTSSEIPNLANCNGIRIMPDGTYAKKLYIVTDDGYHLLIDVNTSTFASSTLNTEQDFSTELSGLGVMTSSPVVSGNYVYTAYTSGGGTTSSIVVTEIVVDDPSSSSEGYSESSSSSNGISSASESSSSSDDTSSSTSSGDFPVFGTTYYSEFKELHSVNNPIVDNGSEMKYSGFFDVGWNEDTLNIEKMGYGLKKTPRNQSAIFCDDASKLFTMSQGYLGMVLSFPSSIVNGVYTPLRNDTNELNEYILWGVNVGQYEIAQPGLYAALTPRGIEFTTKSSKGFHTMTDTSLNAESDEDIFIEFMWDSNNIDDYLVRSIMKINGAVVAAGNQPIGEDFLSGLNFYALNTPFGYNNMECTIKKLVTYNEIPQDIEL